MTMAVDGVYTICATAADLFVHYVYCFVPTFLLPSTAKQKKKIANHDDALWLQSASARSLLCEKRAAANAARYLDLACALTKSHRYLSDDDGAVLYNVCPSASVHPPIAMMMARYTECRARNVKSTLNRRQRIQFASLLQKPRTPYINKSVRFFFRGSQIIYVCISNKPSSVRIEVPSKTRNQNTFTKPRAATTKKTKIECTTLYSHMYIAFWGGLQSN